MFIERGLREKKGACFCTGGKDCKEQRQREMNCKGEVRMRIRRGGCGVRRELRFISMVLARFGIVLVAASLCWRARQHTGEAWTLPLRLCGQEPTCQELKLNQVEWGDI